jgi:hypothetical protein
VVVVVVVAVVVAAVVVVYIYPLFSGPAAPYLLNTRVPTRGRMQARNGTYKRAQQRHRTYRCAYIPLYMCTSTIMVCVVHPHSNAAREIC